MTSLAFTESGRKIYMEENEFDMLKEALNLMRKNKMLDFLKEIAGSNN